MNQHPDTGRPLRRWRLRNFKSVPESEIEFQPLTVLVGANSSGKSSLIQSMLLLIQAAQSHSMDSTMPLNGPFVELGEFGDTRYAGASMRERIAIGGSFSLTAEPARSRDPSGEIKGRGHLVPDDYEWDVELLNAGSESLPGRARLRGVRLAMPALESRIESSGEGVVEFEASTQVRKPLTMRSVSQAAGFQPVVHIEGRFRMGSREGKRQSISTAAFAHRAGVPVALLVPSDENTVLAAGWVRRARHVLRDRRRNPRTDWDRIRDRRNGHVMDSPSDWADLSLNELATTACDRLIDDIVGAIRSETEDYPDHGDIRDQVLHNVEHHRTEAIDRGFWRQLNSLVNDAKFSRAIERSLGRGEAILLPADELDGTRRAAQILGNHGKKLAGFFANSILYLGPLRQDPQVLYTAVPTEQPGFVGKKGEFAIAVLHRNAESVVECPVGDGSVRWMPLRDSVNHWLEKFGMADAIETLYRPRLGLEPQIRMSDVARPLGMTAVGVGVSQLLPVLVMGLHAKPGSVLLIEQPELHLHPAMQQMLGDFLLACVQGGRQVIVETHSDHLVTRLRRRIAEDEEDRVLDLIRFVFAERIHGATRFQPIEPNRYGGFDEWPHGFFDEGATDSQELLRAGMKKKGGDPA